MSDRAATTIDLLITDQPMAPLKALRKERKLAQAAVACAVGCSPNIIVNTERYNYRPTIELQLRIAKFFGVAREEIFPDKSATSIGLC